MLHHVFYPVSGKTHWLPVLLVALAIHGLVLSGCGQHGGGEQWVGAGGGQRVLFVYPGDAERVCVVGSFNGWTHDRDCLVHRDGRWELEMVVLSGRHGYVFFIDGERFLVDPEALLHEDDGFGRVNSVLIVD